ncbi:calmodulin-domain kinase CDPK protein [Medicago truncatula]|uniref:non-specific serine/threonine protein kinase n=1 Tax=Medicago truncatula TaxID=3880 RepID=A0A072UEQ9_MEDTR|nr:calmodulin-domain kinase CDPK protein [Medicago truncatula]
MGNNCVGPRRTYEHESFQTSFWWPWSLSWSYPINQTQISVSQNTNSSQTYQQNPPHVHKIENKDMKTLQSNTASDRQTSISQEDAEPVTQLKEKATPTKTMMSKNINIRRVTPKSAGLRAESVLLTNNGPFREFYKLGDELGKGKFGTTSLCLEKSTRKTYACKAIPKVKLFRENDIEDVRREIEIMHHLVGIPNVISIKGAYEDPVVVYIVMELCEGGELFDRIVERRHYTERKAAKLARTIVNVVEACHSRGVMHRDLKPENFLFVDGDEDSTLMAIDFGLSIFFKPGEKFSDFVGSAYYVAPEVIEECYGPEADVWSAGVIIYILLCGTPPFYGELDREIFDEVLHGEVDFCSDPWPSISESAKDLVKKMLDRDPKTRIKAHEVLSHPWIQVDGVAPDRPLDSATLSRLKQFSAMNKLKKMALRVIAKNLSEEEISGLKESFKTIDTDNTGQITFEKLKVGLKKFGANLSESEIFDLMQAVSIKSKIIVNSLNVTQQTLLLLL